MQQKITTPLHADPSAHLAAMEFTESMYLTSNAGSDLYLARKLNDGGFPTAHVFVIVTGSSRDDMHVLPLGQCLCTAAEIMSRLGAPKRVAADAVAMAAMIDREHVPSDLARCPTVIDAITRIADPEPTNVPILSVSRN